MLNVGLVTVAFTPAIFAKYFINVVLPAPKSPTRRLTLFNSKSYNERAMFSVSFKLLLVYANFIQCNP